MGSSLGCSVAEGDVRNVNGLPSNSRRLHGTVKCHRHKTNDVTHYSSSANGLLCLSCYQAIKRDHQTKLNTLFEIDKYTGTLEFKQRTTKLQEKARLMESRCVNIVRHYDHTKDVFESKRNTLITEVKTFIQSLIELLGHLRDELCQEINKEIDKILTKTAQYSSGVESLSKKLHEYRASLDNGLNGTVHLTRKLQSVLELDNFLEEVNIQTKEYTDYQPRLKLNRALTLSEVLGNLRESRRIKLGKFSVDTKTIRTSDRLTETLDDLTDESSAQASPISTTENTPVPNGRISRGKGKLPLQGNHIVHPFTPDPDLPAPVPQVRAESSLKLTPDSKRELLDAFPVDIPYHEHQKPGRSPSSNRAVSRAASRRVSFSGAHSRQGESTPRRSVLSIVSPGKLDTPMFLTPTPRPGYSVDVERGKVTLVKTIQLPKEKHCQNITSTAMLDDGHIVLCDQKNSSLSLYDSNFSRIDEIKFYIHPHNVTKVSNFGVASTFPDDESIRFLRIENNYFHDAVENIKSKPSCRGIEFIDGNLVYTTGNDVAVLRKDDPKQRTWKFKYAFRKPMSLHVGHVTNSLYVTCFGIKENRGEVVKMNFKAEAIEFVASYPEISRPVCTGVDRHGYVYVCDVKPHGVHQLTPDGRYVRKILGENDGMFQHINFIPNTDMFLVTENNNDKIKIFRID